MSVNSFNPEPERYQPQPMVEAQILRKIQGILSDIFYKEHEGFLEIGADAFAPCFNHKEHEEYYPVDDPVLGPIENLGNWRLYFFDSEKVPATVNLLADSALHFFKAKLEEISEKCQIPLMFDPNEECFYGGCNDLADLNRALDIMATEIGLHPNKRALSPER